MTKHLCATAVFLLVSAMPAAGYAGDATALVPIHRFIDRVNNGNVSAAAAAYAPGAVILDDLPPYLFQGRNAFAQWIADLQSRLKKAGVTGPVFTLMKPSVVRMAGDMAYAVVPARVAFMRRERVVGGETGTFVYVLTKTATGWRIAAWSWARSVESK